MDKPWHAGIEALNYRSIADLSRSIRSNLYKIPKDVDLIVGVPRSGILAASISALHLNLNFCDLDAYLNNKPLRHGRCREPRFPYLECPADAKHVLFVDDSVCSGKSLSIVKNTLERHGFGKKSFCAVYAVPGDSVVDDCIFLERVDLPRVFEWNVMHREELIGWCLDIDGVLCTDPTALENDDGDNYRQFLLNAQPLCLPSYPVGHLVTSRLEKYRSETEAWLSRHGVEYGKLHMLDLPDAETRRSLGCHGAFKAGIYRELQETSLFIESDPAQSREISREAGKHVLCFSSGEMVAPELSFVYTQQQVQRFTRLNLRRVVRICRRFKPNAKK